MRAAAFLLTLALLPLAGCMEGALRPAADGAFLLVREQAWVNVTEATEARLPASFGAHCAEASYSTEPAAVVVRSEDAQPPPGVLVRHFESWSRETVLTTSSDGVSATVVDPAADRWNLTAAANASRTLAAVTFERGEARVDGAPLPAGEIRYVRAAYQETHDGANFSVVEILRFEWFPNARLRTEEPGLCM